MATPPRHTNRLARQKSPYLLQHAHNPVDWFAWQEEAFEKSRREDKPIFLSIGYSTCHWCHVMERESFEDEKIATFLNQHFVSIKVDREERPDVDRIYMMFVQATTGQGGWPLNVFLTPELKPFFGGTYFPPEDRQGRRGFPQFLRQIHELWKGRRDDLANSAAEVQKRLAEAAATQQAASSLLLDPAMLRNAGLFFKQAYDPRHGGFGGAPKFPHPSQPQFLLRYGARFRDPEALEMVLQTCDRMAAGGIHDQLGGGFARYSVDAEWQVPHFEKMLYDNAQLLQLYLDACLVSQELPRPVSAKSPQGPDLSAKQHNALLPPAAQTHAEVARSIMAYVLRDMTHPDGGFYSAEDADSEGHEGKFYCWTPDEVEKLLTPAEFQTAVRYFGITERGNFVDHSHPSPLPNQNVLRVADPTLSDAEKPLVASARKKLLAARSRRVRPHLDDKILASWNGLMLGACARAYAVLGDEAYRAAAEKSLNFIQEKLWVPPRAQGSATGNLFHRWRDGERDEVQLLEGYAFLLGGVIDLYEAALEPKHLDFAIALAEALLTKFHDSQNGGFWETVSDAQHLILRIKQDYDGAEPSGNSVAALALLKLGAITNRKDFAEAGRKSVLWLAPRLRDLPQAVPCLLQALDFLLQEPKRVVIAGDPHSTEARKLLRAVHSVYQPNKVVLGNSGAVDEFTRSLPANGEALVYLCTGTSCRPPTSEASKVREMLRGL